MSFSIKRAIVAEMNSGGVVVSHYRATSPELDSWLGPLQTVYCGYTLAHQDRHKIL